MRLRQHWLTLDTFILLTGRPRRGCSPLLLAGHSVVLFERLFRQLDEVLVVGLHFLFDLGVFVLCNLIESVDQLSQDPYILDSTLLLRLKVLNCLFEEGLERNVLAADVLIVADNDIDVIERVEVIVRL